MPGSRHWSGVQIWLVGACLMIVVEYSSCRLISEMDLMRYKSAEKRGLSCSMCVHKEYHLTHMNTCKNICPFMGKRSYDSTRSQEEDDQKKTADKRQVCIIDPLYHELPEEGKAQIMKVFSNWL